MAEPTASAPAGLPSGQHHRKKLLGAAGPAVSAAMLIGVLAMIIVANFTAPNQAPATGILAAAEAPDAGAYGGGGCAPVMFIGARGSGETPQSNWVLPSAYTSDRYQGLGAELWSLYNRGIL